MSGGELAFITIIGTVLLASALCNILVVVVVAVTPALRNPTNVLISNLAVSDLLLASIVLPQNLHDISHPDLSYYEGDLLCRVVYTGPLLCIMASIYSMVAISFDRTQVILLNVENKLSFRWALFQLAAIWSLAFVFCIPTLLQHTEYVVKETENETVLGCGSNGVSYSYSVTNGTFLLMVAYVIPLVLLLFNYGRILAFFRSKGVFSKQTAHRGVIFQTLFKTRITVVKMLILVAVIFAISWAPYFVMLLLESILDISNTGYAGEAANLLKIALSAFSTAYNFGLYIGYNRNFRLGLLRFLGFSKCARRYCRCWRQVAPSSDRTFVMTQAVLAQITDP